MSIVKLAQLRNRLRTDATNRSIGADGHRIRQRHPERASMMRDSTTPPTAAKGTSGRPLLGGGSTATSTTRGCKAAGAHDGIPQGRAHPGVASGWGCARGLALSARWDVEAADDSPEAQAYAEHVRVNLGIGGRRSPLGRSWGGCSPSSCNRSSADSVGGSSSRRTRSTPAGRRATRRFDGATRRACTSGFVDADETLAGIVQYSAGVYPWPRSPCRRCSI